MTRLPIQALVGLMFIAACGGRSADPDTTHIEPEPVFDDVLVPGTVEVDVEGYSSPNDFGRPYLVGRVHRGPYTVDFIAVMIDSSSEPSVQIVQTAPLGEPPIGNLLQQSLDVKMSAAEFWLGLTEEPLPSYLALEHLRSTLQEGRSQEFFIPKLEIGRGPKARDVLDKARNFDSGLVFTSGPHHCWVDQRREALPATDGVTQWACTGVGQTDPLVQRGAGNVESGGACSVSSDLSSWLRIGIANRTPQDNGQMIDQLCYGPSFTGDWACHAPQRLDAGMYKIWDWDTAHPKKLGHQQSNPASPEGFAEFVTAIGTTGPCPN